LLIRIIIILLIILNYILIVSKKLISFKLYLISIKNIIFKKWFNPYYNSVNINKYFELNALIIKIKIIMIFSYPINYS